MVIQHLASFCEPNVGLKNWIIGFESMWKFKNYTMNGKSRSWLLLVGLIDWIVIDKIEWIVIGWSFGHTIKMQSLLIVTDWMHLSMIWVAWIETISSVILMRIDNFLHASEFICQKKQASNEMNFMQIALLEIY